MLGDVSHIIRHAREKRIVGINFDIDITTSDNTSTLPTRRFFSCVSATMTIPGKLLNPNSLCIANPFFAASTAFQRHPITITPRPIHYTTIGKSRILPSFSVCTLPTNSIKCLSSAIVKQDHSFAFTLPAFHGNIRVFTARPINNTSVWQFLSSVNRCPGILSSSSRIDKIITLDAQKINL